MSVYMGVEFKQGSMLQTYYTYHYLKWRIFKEM